MFLLPSAIGAIQQDPIRRIFKQASLDLQFAEKKSLVDATTGAQLVTFTRASSGTFVGSDGLLRSAVTNLLLRSEEFQTTWTTTRASVTADAAIAPNGTTTADKLVEDSTASNNHSIRQTPTTTVSLPHALSIYVKAAERSIVAFEMVDNGATGNGISAYFNLNTDSTSNVTSFGNGSGASAVMSNVGDGWYRCVLSGVVNTSGTAIRCNVYLSQAAGSVSYTGDGTSGLFIWGAQLEQSSTVGEYIPTTSTINSAPRFDHNPTTGESLGLLVEEARTNLLLRSEDAATTWAQVNVGITTNTTVAPDGQTTADTLSVNATPANLFRQDVTVVASTTYTFSFYARRGTATDLTYSVFNFSGSADIVAPTSYYAQTSASEWRRISLTFTTPVGCTSIGVYPIRSNPSTGTVFFWGAQLEAGAFPTSYIPTTTATVTRSADVCSISGSNFSSWYRQDEGTMFAGQVFHQMPLAEFKLLYDLSDGTIVNERHVGLWSGTNQGYAGTITAGSGVNTSLTGMPAILAGQTAAIAQAWNSAISVAATKGIVSAEASTAGPQSINQMVLRSRIGGTLGFSGTIGRLTFWPQRFPNSTLQTLTQ